MGYRLRNIHRGNRTENEDPLGAEVTFDGQNYFIGPGQKLNVYNDGIAKSLVSQSQAGDARVDYDKGQYGAAEGYIKY